jgi:RsiW-degrading membrane proteinase PrsW (M82 family)
MESNDFTSQNKLLNRAIPLIFVFVFLGLLFSSFFFLGFLLAFLVFGPIAFALAWFFYGYLRVRPFHIPIKLMFLVGYGGVFIIFTTLILNQLGALNALVGILLIGIIIAPELWLTVLTVVIVAPLVEEFTKALPNMLFYWSKERSVSSSDLRLGERKGLLYSEYRGLFFGIMAGAIFTVLETYLYVFINLPAFGVTDLFQYWLQVVLRSGAPIHVGGGMLTGYALGKADRLRKNSNSGLSQFKTFFIFYALAVLLHLSWNGSSVLFSLIAPGIFIFDIISLAVFVILGVLVYIIGFKLMKNSLNIARDYSSCERCDLKHPSELIECPHCLKNLETIERKGPEMDLTKICKSCNETYPSSDEFCKKCGQELSSLKGLDTDAERKPHLLTIPTLLMLMMNILLGFALVLGGYLLILLATTTGVAGAILVASFVLLIGILSFAGVLGVYARWYSGWYISILFAITIAASVILVISFGLGFLIISIGASPITGLVLGFGIFVIAAILLILISVFTKEEDFLTMRFKFP